MSVVNAINTRNDRKSLLSTLWIFVMFNYLYCDLLSNMQADVLRDYLNGHAASFQITPMFQLGAGILMEIPTVMILLAFILPRRANRWANIIAGSIMTIVQVSSLFVGTGPTPHYIFYSIIEVSCTAAIVWLAATWRDSAKPAIDE